MASNAPDSKPYGRLKLMTTVRKSSPGTFQTPRGTPIFGPSMGWWRTPRANDWKGGVTGKKGSKRNPSDFFLPDQVNASLASPPLISSPAAFLANPSHTPGSDEARRMTAISGRRCFALYEISGHPSSWQRTSMASLLTKGGYSSTRCFLIWKPAITRRSRRLLFRLVPSMPRTGGIGFGFWPTPDTTSGAPNLGSNKRHGPRSLLQVAQEMWPTPTANRRDGLQSHGKNIVSGSLNPTWVEWLMGFPLGWTVCEHWGMRSSPPLPRK